MPIKSIQKAEYVIMRLMARMMPSCKDISQLVSESMDRDLPLRQRFSIRFHLSLCGLCRRYEKQLRLLREGATHYADPSENSIEKPLSLEGRERLKKALRPKD